ncbi:hypothetical protein NRP93_002899 [Clostridium botulinum]|nr:hypothetical protein [Clostridium botulinum]
MNVFHLLPISISHFEINHIEQEQLEEQQRKFIDNIKGMEYTKLKKEDFTANIVLDLFSICFKVNDSIDIFLKYQNYILDKKEMDAYDPLKKISIDTGKEKLNLTLELVSLKPYKVKISGSLYKKYDNKWEVRILNQIIAL